MICQVKIDFLNEIILIESLSFNHPWIKKLIGRNTIDNILFE